MKFTFVQKHRTYLLIPTFTWGFFILYLTLRPKSTVDIDLPLWVKIIPIDKIAHFLFWGIWYFIYHVTFLRKEQELRLKFFSILNFKLNQAQFMGILTMVLVGAFVELMQGFLNWGREAEWLDLIADTGGIFAFFIVLKRYE